MEPYDQAIRLWETFSINTSSELDQSFDRFRILFAFHSGKIENQEITYRDTRDIYKTGRVSNFTGDPRALFEQENQKLCYEFLKDKILKKEPLNLALILEIHRTLTGGIYDESRYVKNGERPGELKHHDYVIGIHEVGSSKDNVESDLKELLKEVDTYDGKEILKAGAYLHAGIEFIHPFADGNGRVGRTVLNYYLMIHDHPPLIVYYEDKQLYYECLQKYDECEKLNPLFEFLKFETGKTWGEST